MLTYIKRHGIRGLLASFIFICIGLMVPHSSHAEQPPQVAQIVSVTSPQGNGGPYKAGSTIEMRVTYDSAIIVTGTPTIFLNSGGTAIYTSQIGPNTLVFTYTVLANQNSTALDWMGSSALMLNGGSILNSEGTPASLSAELPVISTESNIVIDTVAPTVTAKIAGGAPFTSMNNVKLTLNDNNTVAAYMQFSDNSELWSDWEPYSSTKAYMLPLGTGLKTVFVKVKDAAGNVSQLFATTITLLQQNEVNLALNPIGVGYPQVTASYTCCGNNEDNAWSTVNGIFSYSDNPRDRWTNYNGNLSDWLALDFGSMQTFNQIKLYVFNDGGGVKSPSSYSIQYWNESQWIDIPILSKSPSDPYAAVSALATPGNTLNVVDFNSISSSKIKIIMNKGSASVGLVELEVFFHVTSQDSIAANAVISAIEGLPTVGVVTLLNKGAIEAVRNAYNSLSAMQKTLVANLGKLVILEGRIVELEESHENDVNAAEPVISAIDNLPALGTVKLSHSQAIQAARSAYAALTESQKLLVNNLGKLTDVEAAILELEGRLRDVPLLSSFSNRAGNEITIKVTNQLDIYYTLDASLFQIIVNGEVVAVSEAYYDVSDPSHQTIKLMISSPLLQEATTVALRLQPGALQTNFLNLNRAILAMPTITFKQLDLTQDAKIGIDDIALISSNPARNLDVNHDGVYDRRDVVQLLSQISLMSE